VSRQRLLTSSCFSAIIRIRNPFLALPIVVILSATIISPKRRFLSQVDDSAKHVRTRPGRKTLHNSLTYHITGILSLHLYMITISQGTAVEQWTLVATTACRIWMRSLSGSGPIVLVGLSSGYASAAHCCDHLLIQ
jgi:hypothetical protein